VLYARTACEMPCPHRCRYRAGHKLTLLISLFFDKHQKRVGRPPTGQTPMMDFRANPELRSAIEGWAEIQHDKSSLSEAVRRLVELGLTVKPKARPRAASQRDRARELAGKAIDKMADASATDNDQAVGKRRPIK
jgi:hypothetical protein